MWCVFWAGVVATTASAQPIPEPLVFDLVLSLGARQGQLEANSVFFFPADSGSVSWTPEVEGAPIDNLGVELELPFAGDRLTGFNLGAQYTLGDRGPFTHAVQGRFERDTREGNDLVGLYIAGLRFNSVWSALLMAGVRGRLGSEREEDFKFLFNAALFAELGSWTLGVETNASDTLRRTESFGLIPQLHYDVTEHFGVLAGFRWLAEERVKNELVFRAFYAF